MLPFSSIEILLLFNITDIYSCRRGRRLNWIHISVWLCLVSVVRSITPPLIGEEPPLNLIWSLLINTTVTVWTNPGTCVSLMKIWGESDKLACVCPSQTSIDPNSHLYFNPNLSSSHFCLKSSIYLMTYLLSLLYFVHCKKKKKRKLLC